MHFKYLLITLIIFTLGCSKNETIEFFNIKPEIEISLSQNVNSNGPYAEMIISTKDSIQCINAVLEVNTTFLNNFTSIQIKGVEKNGQCISGNSKPTYIQNLGSLTARTINVILKEDIVNVGSLTNDNGIMQLSFESVSGIILKDKKINQIPDKAVWGYFTTSNQSNATQAFKDLLIANNTRTQKVDFKQYGLFNTGFDEQVAITDPILNKNTIIDNTFFIEYKDWPTFKQAVDELRKAYPDFTLIGRNYQDKAL